MTRADDSDTRLAQARETWDHASAQADLLARLARTHGGGLAASAAEHWQHTARAARAVLAETDPLALGAAWRDYLVDMQQRAVLFLDVLRRRGDAARTREADGLKPVLAFDYDVVLDGADLPRPVNYALVRIRAGADHPPTRADGRPWVIIDPRAGHGSGIGGFKAESEVGEALADGHPVYFVIFRPDPAPEQTLGDVVAAEAAFLRRVSALHPKSPRPLVTGNCQGGWGAMILAATHPDLTGPLVIAGAPLSYWAGQVGRNPFRYYGGLAGGAVPALLAADLGGGRFDGAHLVQNFEALNPARTWWRKNYDLFAGVDTGADRFLEFERWWSGFYFMNEAEIRWILENLFIGNRLTAGRAALDDGTPVDLTRITAPVVVFASHGDNITPPQQALQWIPDLYHDTDELRARGHVIVYTLHDSVGHLGIFVSAKIASTQHKQITSVVKTIESLAPGLYEMIISQGPDGGYAVEFQARGIEDIRRMGDGPDTAEEFAAVAELSDLATKGYDVTLRPLLRATVTPQMAEASRRMHPLRLQTAALSSQNPLMQPLAPQAEAVRRQRMPAGDGNPFLRAERLAADIIERNWDLFRDTRDAWIEMGFHALYASPWMRHLARQTAQPVHREPRDVRAFPEVREMLEHVDRGGYAEAIVRMMILLARARGAVRRERLERANALLHAQAPFATMEAAHRNQMIHEQSLIVDLAQHEAIAALPRLLRDDVDRIRALNLVLEVAGPAEEMDANTIAMFERFQSALSIRARNWTGVTRHAGSAAR